MTVNKAIEYFNENAESLSVQYNGIDRATVHQELIKFMPKSGSLRMLDVGAGSGADAAFFAGMGHEVVAAEPAKNLRKIANKVFKNKKIKWNADKLPELKTTTSSGRKFDVVYSVGTLQYLDAEDREKSLDKMASLLKDKGLLEIQYPTPASREFQFSVGPDEISDFVKAFNGKFSRPVQLSILQQANVKDSRGRKALDGSDLYFSTTIIQRI